MNISSYANLYIYLATSSGIVWLMVDGIGKHLKQIGGFIDTDPRNFKIFTHSNGANEEKELKNNHNV